MTAPPSPLPVPSPPSAVATTSPPITRPTGPSTRATIAPRRPLPVLAVGLALFLAALGAAPAALGLLNGVAGWPELALRGLLLSSRAAATLVRTLAAAEAGTWAVLWTAATAILLVLGVLVARSAHPKETA